MNIKKQQPVQLSPNHWTFWEYKQRMTTKEWKYLLLNEQDSIIYGGIVVPLKAKSLGFGVVEVFKDTTAYAKKKAM